MAAMRAAREDAKSRARRACSRRAREGLAKQPRPFFVRLESAQGLRAADAGGNTSDPFCFISVSEGATPNRRQVSLARSSTKPKTLSPVWAEDILVAGVDGSARVTFTVCDKDVLGKSDFLGQASVRLRAQADLFDGKPRAPAVRL